MTQRQAVVTQLVHYTRSFSLVLFVSFILFFNQIREVVERDFPDFGPVRVEESLDTSQPFDVVLHGAKLVIEVLHHRHRDLLM